MDITVLMADINDELWTFLLIQTFLKEHMTLLTLQLLLDQFS